ncbi:MAG: galactonate dehydratase [Verrucomicrobiae bacterium]|nr:galactonate dehydratase [Verrucomicrobiae bacterium]
MKVTGIETFICDVYRTNWVLVKVLTDSGLYGVGEATLEHRELTVEAAVKELERYLAGRNPHDIEAFWHDAHRDAYWRGGVVLMSALSAVEMALWDIKGKDLGVPVYQLLGGKVRDTIPCYANAWFAGAKTPEEFAAKAKAAAGMGFKGLKWDPFGAAYLNLTPMEFRTALDCVAAVRDAVGKEVFLLIEGHGRFNIPTAVRVGRALEEFEVLWFEEPVPPGDLDGLAEVKRRIPVPVAAGERLYTRWDYRDFFNRKCADFAQPDVSHAGGIMEMRKIAAMAECHFIPFCPHNPSGSVANAATLQLAACTPNFYLLETMFNDVPYRNCLTTEKIQLKNGCMPVPDAPGLGIDLKEEELRRHPYQPHHLRHYAGALTDIRPKDGMAYFELQKDDIKH